MRRALTFGLALMPLVAGPAAAQQRPELRFKVAVWPDGVVIGAAVAAALVPAAWANAFPKTACAPCNPAGLWGVDRSTVGPLRPTANALSFASLGAEAALGALFLASSRRGQGTAAFVEDATVIAQAVSLTAVATEWAKVLFDRPRPFRYLPGATAPPSGEDTRSMPSSHTSLAFAAAAAYASVLHRRGLAGSNKLQIGALFAAAAATGVLRVAAHQHFPTDVVAGAALGFAIGWTVPALHAAIP